MEIDFPNMVMPKVTMLGTVSFQARVDREYIWCEISREALRVHFGAGSMQDDELLSAFCRGKTGSNKQLVTTWNWTVPAPYC